MQSTTLIGMDIAKYSFELWGLDAQGKHTLHKRLHRDQVSLFFSNFPPCTIAMEACGSSQHWARKLTQLGHQVRLIPAQHVIPFRQGSKIDRNDAEAIAEAAARPRIRTVPVKTLTQQDLQAIHRIRERLIHNRTALVNEIRGLLMEYGIVRPKGFAAFRRWLQTDLLTSIERLSPMAQETFRTLHDEFQALEDRITALEQRITQQFKTDSTCQRLATVPGVGPLIATALLSSVADPQRFNNGRQFAAYLGLVPRQHSTGGRTKLLGITKGATATYVSC